MALVKPKANYKIFDKKVGKYVSSGYKSKSTWTSEFWAMSAAEDYGKSRGGKSYLETNIEIHIFPVEAAVKVSYKEMLEKSQEKEKKKEEKKKEEQDRREKAWLLEQYKKKRAELDQIFKKGKQLGLTLEEDGTYVIHQGEHKKLKDEWGNTDWRDTGEMGG